MKKQTHEHFPLIKESLLGGAALTLFDLEIVEAQEIEWSIVSKANDLFDVDS